MKEDWNDILKQKLEGHQMTPPAGLWEGISEQMGLTPKPARRPARIVAWWATAAAVLALVGIFLFNGYDEPEEKTAESQPQKALVQETAPEPVVASKPAAKTIAQGRTPFRARPTVKPTETDKQTPQESMATPTLATTDTAGTNDGKPQMATIPQRLDERSIHQPSSETTRHKTDRHKWSVDLNMSGGLLANATQTHSGRLYHMRTEVGSSSSSSGLPYWVYDAQNYLGTTDLYSINEYIAEHSLPVRFGMNVNYHLSQRLSLLAGVNYTYLYSQFRVTGYDIATTDQRLYYLGIPLGLSYRLWSASRFSLYVAGSAEIDKCLNESPWQLSVNAAAGAEYSLFHQWSLYVEPSLGYYFDDGSALQHYYKEHPLGPAIELGVRLHLNDFEK